MSFLRTIVSIASVLFIIPLLAAMESQDRQSAWDTMIHENPSVVDDSSISWRDRLILYALTPEQAREYYSGADPDMVLLGSGETLRQYLDRKTEPKGNLYYPLPVPCPLFSLDGIGSAEPVPLKARGTDLSHQGGSPTGCGIPEEATALMVQVKVEFPSKAPSRVKLWAIDSPEPAEALVDSFTGYSDSTMAVVPLNRLEPSEPGELQVSISDWTVIEGEVVGYFRKATVGEIPGSEVSFFTESTASTPNDYFGYGAGGNATGNFNAFFGFNAGFGGTSDPPNTPNSGDHNVFSGYRTGFSNTTGSYNVFTGSNSGAMNESGSRNVFSGNYAGYNNLGTKSGVCEDSMCGSDNVFTGSAAGYKNSVGMKNVFSGSAAGYSNQKGSYNVFTGYRSGYFNNDGTYNAFFGNHSGANNRGQVTGICETPWCGSYNVFIGNYAGANNSTGAYNTFTGNNSGYSNTTGSRNVFNGSYSGYNSQTGSRNVFSGYLAGYSNKTESRNTMIGYYADLDPGPDPENSPVENATAIGYSSFVSQSNSLVLGSIDGVNSADASVNVGIGTTAPAAPLHVNRSDSTTRIILAESTGPEAVRNMMDLKNNGMAQFRLIDTSPNGDAWQFSNTDNNLNISLQGSGSQEFLIENDGDVWINNGTIMVTSYRDSKENFRELDTQEILRRVADLPLSDWNYRKDSDSVRHIGPVSEDFYQAFGYGEDNKHISPNDLAGVNTAAIQELYHQNRELKTILLKKNREIADLKNRLIELETMKHDLVEIREVLGISSFKKTTHAK
jgi:hypothetical protein